MIKSGKRQNTSPRSSGLKKDLRWKKEHGVAQQLEHLITDSMSQEQDLSIENQSYSNLEEEELVR